MLTTGPTDGQQQPDMIDWDFAVRFGSKIAGDGPQMHPHEMSQVVEELRFDANRSTGLVREFTGLVAANHNAPVLVVDRPSWIQANAEAFAQVITPLVDKMGNKKPPTGLTLKIGSRITGAEVGGLLGFLGGKVLGQFDPFGQPETAPDGRLLLVAPNIVQIERELDVDPTDFRLWVCLHEETHRVQFTAVPWMRQHLFDTITQLSDTMEPSKFLEEGFPRLVEGLKSGAKGGSLLDIMGSPEQKEILDKVTGMMSLLEGHADFVMDGVGPTVIPSVEDIRAKFTLRRKGVGTLDRIIRRLLGLEAKMAQYRDGAAFVTAVVNKVGMEEFNAVWASPDNLPTKAELTDTDGWISRVLA